MKNFCNFVRNELTAAVCFVTFLLGFLLNWRYLTVVSAAAAAADGGGGIVSWAVLEEEKIRKVNGNYRKMCYIVVVFFFL